MKTLFFPIITIFALGYATGVRGALIVYHEFESETAGVFTDTAGSFDGTSEPSAGLLDTGTKKIGSGSASLNGSAHIDLGNTDSSLTGISGFTLSTWIRPTNTSSGDRTIFGNTDTNKASVILRMDGSELELGMFTGGNWNGSPNVNKTSGAGLAANTWTHIALVWDGDYATIYTDGTFEKSFNMANGTLDRQGVAPAPSAAIGAFNGDGAQYFIGHIDDFAIWDEALTSTQIMGLANETLTPSVIPEPSTALLVVGGLFASLLFSRKRTSK